MKKGYLVFLLAAAFLIQGCDAFKDHYDPPPEEVLEQLMTVPEEEKPVEEAMNLLLLSNPAKNQTIVPLEVDFDETGASLSNAGWTTDVAEGEKISARVEELGETTTKITIIKGTNPAERLSFTFDQTDEGTINVRNVLYTACTNECIGVPSVWSSIEKGSISIGAFDQDTAHYSAKYDLTFKSSNIGETGVSINGAFDITAEGTSNIK